MSSTGANSVSEAQPTINIYNALRRTRAQELYDAAIVHMQNNLLDDAVLLFAESSFFAPDNANPLVAQAECYVFMCDLQSAVRCYRQALWLLQKAKKRRAEARKSVAASQRGDENIKSHRGSTKPGNKPPKKQPLSSSSTLPGDADDRQGDDVANGPDGGVAYPPVNANGQSETEAFMDDSTIDLRALRRRLVGLLDALGLAAYRMADFVQALRFADEAAELVGTAHPNGAVDLHRCIYLIALEREEKAEFALELHLRSFPAHRTTTVAMLVQLYCKRQAFREARQLMEAEEGPTVARASETLTVARHIFNELYGRYRDKALERNDKGTISRCIEVFPSDAELLFARAKILIAEGQHKRSVKDLFRVIKESNGAHKEAVEMMTTVLFQIGSSLDGEEGLREAVSYYSESLKWRGDNTNVLLARADCYVKLQDFVNGLADYNAIRKLDPEDTVARRRIAFLHDMWGRKLCAEGNLPAAEKEFTNAIVTDDTEPLFYQHRALCRFDMNEPRFGLRDVLSCQQLKPADPKIRAFIVRYLGTDAVPDTTHQSKEARGDKDLIEYNDKGEPRLRRPNVPASSVAASKRAVALFGQPSARITKAQQQAASAREARPGLGAASPRAPRPRRGHEPTHTGAVGKGFLTYKDFVMQQQQQQEQGQKPHAATARVGGTGDLFVAVSGRRTNIHDRGELPQPVPKESSLFADKNVRRPPAASGGRRPGETAEEQRQREDDEVEQLLADAQALEEGAEAPPQKSTETPETSAAAAPLSSDAAAAENTPHSPTATSAVEAAAS